MDDRAGHLLEVGRHLMASLSKTPVSSLPFAHAAADGLFPGWFFDELVRARPRDFLEQRGRLGHLDGRRQVALTDSVLDDLEASSAGVIIWRDVREILNHPDHPREAFQLRGSAPYRPNTAFLCMKSDTSFRGVEAVRAPGAERWVLVHTWHRWL